MLADLIDLQNLSIRLNDFVGKKKNDQNFVDNFFNFLRSHKLTSAFLIIGIIIISFATFTDSISKIHLFFKSYFSEVHSVKPQEIPVLKFKVYNTSTMDVKIFPYLKFYLTESDVFHTSEYKGGRLEINSDMFVVQKNDTSTFSANLSSYLYNSELFQRGNGTIHFQLFVENIDSVLLESMPFIRNAFEKYYLEYSIDK